MQKRLALGLWALALMVALPFLLSPGCLMQVQEQDKFYNDSSGIYDLSKYQDPAACSPVDAAHPCYCMMCYKDQGWLSRFGSNLWGRIRGLFTDGAVENTLAGYSCDFMPCNNTEMSKSLGRFDPASGAQGTCDIGELGTVSCMPRFFMVGMGPNSGEFSLAQRLCDGEMNMPVTWVTPQEGGRPPKPPAPAKMMCYLTKNQLPIVVWYSAGERINVPEYAAMAASYNRPDDGNMPIEGPVVLTTEAMLDAVRPDGSIDRALLDQVGGQIDAAKAACPKCLVALAPKARFNSSRMPDLCVLDYFLALSPESDPKPEVCASRMGMSAAQYAAARGRYWDKVNLIGVGFIANEDPNMSVCSPDIAVAYHQLYSQYALQYYRKPSVWYAVGIGAGPTNTPGCSFTNAEVAGAYNAILGGLSGMVHSGIIGVAPYRYLDSPDQLPMACAVKPWLMRPDITDLSSITVGRTVGDADNPLRPGITVARMLEPRGGAVRFAGADGHTYEARIEGGLIQLHWEACEFGFRDANGKAKDLETAAWFSSCQFYYTNKAPLFSVDSASVGGAAAIRPGTLLRASERPGTSLEVYSVTGVDAEEGVRFITADNQNYLARQEGTRIDVFAVPLTKQSTQQPVVFSRNGKGPYCMGWDTNKMYSRAFTAKGTLYSAAPIYPPVDPERARHISLRQCGLCMADVPMPKAFCYRKGIEFESRYCPIYPQIDDAVLAQDFDPLFMRAVMQQESSFIRTATSQDEGSASACGGQKSCDDLYRAAQQAAATQDPGAPASISPEAVRDRCLAVQGRGGAICAMGLSQCIDAPFRSSPATRLCGGANYNPFDPYQSACCGTYKVTTALQDAESQILQRLATNANWRKFIKPGEERWFAAWVAMRSYRGAGPSLSDLDRAFGQSVETLNKYGGPVGYIDQTMYAGSKVQYYSTNAIVRYNDAIDQCAGGCPYRDCDAIPTTGGAADWTDDSGLIEEVILP